jgi:hypothetical protein
MLRSLFVVAVATVLVSFAGAEDKPAEKAKTLEGKLVCTKCELKETAECGHCLIVKEKDKEIKYYLDDKGGKEAYHGDVCQEPKDAKVTGKVSKKGDKNMIGEVKVEFKK